MTYDLADGYVLLFGGLNSGSTSSLGDTWKFTQGTWTPISSSGPSPRYGAAMTYDRSDGYVVLFGGASMSSGPSYSLFGDTWNYSAGRWQNITLTSGLGPNARAGASFADDPADSFALLFGGLGSANVAEGDSWNFTGGVWTPVTPIGAPPPRYYASMSYDAADLEVVLFGGNTTASSSTGDTWTFGGGVWSDVTAFSVGPPPRYSSTLAYDARDGYLVLFGGHVGSSYGGTNLVDTWTFASDLWLDISSQARAGPVTNFPSMTYDGIDRYVVLAGVGSSGLEETWNFSLPAPFNYLLSNVPPLIINGPGSGSVTVTATLTSGNVQPVALSCVSSSLPAGITCGSFSVNPVTPGQLGADSILTINVDSSVRTGTYNFQVTGSPLGATTTPTTVTVNVASFDFSLTGPGSIMLEQGATSSSIAGHIVALLTSGSPAPVTFSVTSTLPSGVTADFGINPCSPTCTTSIGFSASTTATLGTSTVMVQAAGEGVTKIISIPLTILAVFNFTMQTSLSTLTVIQGSTSQSSTITATLVGGTPISVGFILTDTSLPAGITPIFTNNPCIPTCAVTVSFSAAYSAPIGTFTLTILGLNGLHRTQLSLTVLPPSVLSVGCGHGLTCSVLSNSTLSNIGFAGSTLHVEADGPHGAHGYANVTVPKSNVPIPSDLQVFIDSNRLENSAVTITSNSTAYFVYFTFTFHSPVKVDIQLSAPVQAPNLPIMGLDPIVFYAIVGAIAALIIVTVAVTVVRRRGKSRTASGQ